MPEADEQVETGPPDDRPEPGTPPGPPDEGRGPDDVPERPDLESLRKAELWDRAKSLGLDLPDDALKADLVTAIAWAEEGGAEPEDPLEEGECFECQLPAVWESESETATKIRLCEFHAPGQREQFPSAAAREKAVRNAKARRRRGSDD